MRTLEQHVVEETKNLGSQEIGNRAPGHAYELFVDSPLVLILSEADQLANTVADAHTPVHGQVATLHPIVQ